MKKLSTLTFAILLTIVLGCKKKQDDVNNTYLLTQITQSSATNTVNTSYTYDDQNHIISQSDGDLSETFTYDNSDRLTRTITNRISTGYNEVQNFTYSSGIISATSTYKYTSTPTYTANYSFSLNDKQQIIRNDLDNTGNNYNIISYDAAGNIVSIIGYLNGLSTPSTKVAYSYDQNKNYFPNVKGNLYLILGFTGISNNYITSVASDLVHSTIDSDRKVTYEYNADGYPVKGILTNKTKSGTTITTTATFTYKIK